jgi:hypothetical protein
MSIEKAAKHELLKETFRRVGYYDPVGKIGV